MATPRRKAPAPRPRRRLPAPPELGDPALYLNRELSWLDFNLRVLEEARDRGLIELDLDDKSGGYTVRSLA